VRQTLSKPKRSARFSSSYAVPAHPMYVHTYYAVPMYVHKYYAVPAHPSFYVMYVHIVPIMPCRPCLPTYNTPSRYYAVPACPPLCVVFLGFVHRQPLQAEKTVFFSYEPPKTNCARPDEKSVFGLFVGGGWRQAPTKNPKTDLDNIWQSRLSPRPNS
jgi:hypothetical protein